MQRPLIEDIESDEEVNLLNSSNSQIVQKREQEIHIVLTSQRYEENQIKLRKRERFEKSLGEAGLLLEIDEDDSLNVRFVKINLPSNLEQYYAEDFGIQKLVEKFENQRLGVPEEKASCLGGIFDWLLRFREPNTGYEEPSFHSQIKCNRNDQPFIRKISARNFSYAQKSAIVYQILLRTEYDGTAKVGIENLINEEVYTSFFPLHQLERTRTVNFVI
jgi:hypothetical protein